MSETIILRTDY